MLQCYFWPSACSFGHPEPLSDLEWSSWTCKYMGAGDIVIQVFPLGGHQELMSQSCSARWLAYVSLVRLCHQEENTIWHSLKITYHYRLAWAHSKIEHCLGVVVNWKSITFGNVVHLD